MFIQIIDVKCVVFTMSIPNRLVLDREGLTAFHALLSLSAHLGEGVFYMNAKETMTLETVGPWGVAHLGQDGFTGRKALSSSQMHMNKRKTQKRSRMPFVAKFSTPHPARHFLQQSVRFRSKKKLYKEYMMMRYLNNKSNL